MYEQQNMPSIVFHLSVDVFLAMLIGFIFFGCMWLKHKLCPYNSMFTPLELEDIRIERAVDREQTIMGRIDRMKVRN